MNKYTKAYACALEYMGGDKTSSEYKVLKDLVDRATPIKPIYKMNSYNYNQPYCGRCNSMIESNSYKYCHYCGQALKIKGVKI